MIIYFKQPIKTTTEVRLRWHILGRTPSVGNGLWYPVNDRYMLQSYADDLCRRYGQRTHWIEERTA